MKARDDAIAVPIFGVGQLAKSPVVSSQRRINLYAESAKDAERSGFTIYPMPGLLSVRDIGGAAIRGIYGRGDYLYFVHGSTFYDMNNSGVVTSRGTVSTTSGNVSFADNGVQLMLVDGTDGYIYNMQTNVFATIADGDFPAATTVTYESGYFITDAGSGQRWYISSLNDGTAWDATEYASADSNPDDIVRVHADHGEVIIFGTFSTEFWTNSGATDFPYQRIQTVETGLAAKWSLCKFMSSLVFLGQNRMGDVQVYVLNGYTPQAISTPELESIINAYGAVGDAEAYSFVKEGHVFYQITFPTADRTWVYDATSQLWSERETDGGRHRTRFATQWLGNTYCTDPDSGVIYKLDPALYTEGGEYVTRKIVTRHLHKNGDFFSVDEICVDMESGIGLASGQGSDPQIMMRVSKDGGRSWGAELWRDMGRVGEYTTRAIWRAPVGVCRDFTAEFTVTDPVKTVFLGGLMRIS